MDYVNEVGEFLGSFCPKVANKFQLIRMQVFINTIFCMLLRAMVVLSKLSAEPFNGKKTAESYGD